MSVLKTEIDSRTLETLLLCATRYSLGRQTYMPSLVQEICKSYANFLSEPFLTKLATEIAEEYSIRGNLGADFDTRDWLNFKDWLLREAAARTLKTPA